jgi:hypothetical protein
MAPAVLPEAAGAAAGKGLLFVFFCSAELRFLLKDLHGPCRRGAVPHTVSAGNSSRQLVCIRAVNRILYSARSTVAAHDDKSHHKLPIAAA